MRLHILFLPRELLGLRTAGLLLLAHGHLRTSLVLIHAGLSLGHNISMAAFGGTAPMMATAIMRDTGNEGEGGRRGEAEAHGQQHRACALHTCYARGISWLARPMCPEAWRDKASDQTLHMPMLMLPAFLPTLQGTWPALQPSWSSLQPSAQWVLSWHASCSMCTECRSLMACELWLDLARLPMAAAL